MSREQVLRRRRRGLGHRGGDLPPRSRDAATAARRIPGFRGRRPCGRCFPTRPSSVRGGATRVGRARRSSTRSPARGIDTDELPERAGLVDADPIDILVHLAWNQPLATSARPDPARPQGARRLLRCSPASRSGSAWPTPRQVRRARDRPARRPRSARGPAALRAGLAGRDRRSLWLAGCAPGGGGRLGELLYAA